MSLQTFLKELEKGFPAPVYLLYSEDPFLQREAIDAIKTLVPPAERDFNLHIFDLSGTGDEAVALERMLDVANTVSFFGGRRFTICTGNLQKLPKKDLERINAYVSDPAPDSLLVLVHGGVLSKEAREKFKALKPMSLDVRESEIPFWLKQRARMKGVEISDRASDYLIGLVGPDLGLLSAEIEKISLLSKDKIGVDDISDIITGGKLYSIFDLVDALRARDPQRVFKTYKALRETAEDYGLIGALNWQYSRGMNSRNSRAEDERLLRIFELLNGADIDIKSSGRSFPMEYLLARLLRLQGGPP